VAALVGVPGTERTTYEGQAAIELELAAGAPENRAYPFELRWESDTWVVETRELVAAVVEDVLAGQEQEKISARFHRTMAEIVAACCERLREAEGVSAVALSGGTFQNALLLKQITELLWEKNFAVYRHRHVPANDGGISLGQAILADWLLREEDS
jgi:hydrogenase maturation protein HypF